MQGVRIQVLQGIHRPGLSGLGLCRLVHAEPSPNAVRRMVLRLMLLGHEDLHCAPGARSRHRAVVLRVHNGTVPAGETLTAPWVHLGVLSSAL
jgi:hypothetical protein